MKTETTITLKEKHYPNKYIGKTFEGYEVIERKLKNSYKKSYAGNPTTAHRAYDYVLFNKKENKTITISGNELRLINNGKRTIKEMFNNDAPGSKNSMLNELKKQKRLSKLGKFVRDWTFKDFRDYCNARVSDGNWSMMIAMTCTAVMQDKPVFHAEKWFRKHLAENDIFNIHDYPDLVIDIKTGQVLHID